MTIGEGGPYGFGAAFPACPGSLRAWASYLEGWRSQTLAAERGRRAYVGHAQREALRLAQILYTEFHATRVYLFGSLTRGSARETSDIDLAVEGLDPERYREACARLEHATDVPVDLIDLADAPKTLIRRVQEEGVVLRERLGPR